MKTKTIPALAATLGAIVALLSPAALAQGNSGNAGNGNSANNSTNNSGGNSSNNAPDPSQFLPVIPVGWIDAYPVVLQVGTHPTIRWGINYPSQVADVIDIEGPGTVVAKEEICVDCRILGNGVTVTWSNGNWEFVPAEALISFNGGSYERVFYGANQSVNPATVVWQRCEIQANQKIRFGGRYFWSNQWGPLHTSSDNTQNVRILMDGQMPPSDSGIQPGVPTIEEFIKPYLDADGRINIGPMDIIVLMELTHTDAQRDHYGYDLQDMVMICNVKPKTKNNNRSGLGDGTNPGQGNQMGNNDGTNNPNNAPNSGGSN